MPGRSNYLGRADRGLGAKSVLAVLTKVAPGVSTFVTNLMIGRLGGAPLLGLTQTAISTAAFTSLLYPAPAASAGSRYVSAAIAAEDPEKAAAVATYLGRRVLFSIACLTVGILGGSLILRVDNTTAVVVACVMTAGLSMRLFIEGLHFGGGQSRRLAIWSVSVAAVGISCSAALLLLGNRTAWVVVPVAVANIVFAIVTWPKRSASPLGVADRRLIRNFILIAAFGTLASSGFMQLTTLVANLAVGVNFAGEYAAALTLTTPLAILATAISATLFPALSAMHAGAGAETVRRHVSEASNLLTALIGAAVCAMIVLSGPIVHIVWGSQYVNTWWILILLLIGTMATTIAVPSVTALTSGSNRGMLISAGSSLVGALVGMAVWITVIPHDSRLGVILGCAVAATLTGVVPHIIVWRRYRMQWARSAAELFGIVLLSGGIVILLRLNYVDAGFAPLMAFGVVLAWVLIRKRDVVRMWALFRSARGKR